MDDCMNKKNIISKFWKIIFYFESRLITIIGMLGLGVYYLFIYWACGPSRGREVVRGG